MERAKQSYLIPKKMIWACAAINISIHHPPLERHRALRCNKLYHSKFNLHPAVPSAH